MMEKGAREEDGPLSDEAYTRIREAVGEQHGKAQLVESLFDDPVGKSR
jgi:hypothetical protein